MGTLYILVNKTKEETLDLPLSKYFEILGNHDCCLFVTWYLLDNIGDFIYFIHDNNSYDYPDEYYKFKNNTEIIIKKFFDWKKGEKR